VPIKQVPETKSVKMDEKTGTVIRDGVDSIVNPLDLYAIETAIRLRDERGGGITAVTMGPPKAEKALREAVSMGVDDAVLISDKAFAASDTWATSYILGEAILTLGDFDLIICGERATDGDTGQVGPELAAHLRLPVATYVNSLKEVLEGGCVVERTTETGVETLSVPFPCVLTVVKEVGEPRLPTYKGKKRAKNQNVAVLGMDDLKLDADKIGLKGSPTRVASIFRPKVARECELLFAKDERSLEMAVEKLAAFIS
jgi:electron transfer flavoprotein beta subunit